MIITTGTALTCPRLIISVMEAGQLISLSATADVISRIKCATSSKLSDAEQLGLLQI